MSKSILVFAADHRQHVDWQLPFIRIGNMQSDACLRTDKILDDGMQVSDEISMSEIRQAIAVSRCLKELGNPDYVGFCHYRRFFCKKLPSNAGLIDVKESQFIPEFALDPEQQMQKLEKNKADMLLFSRVQSYPQQVKSQITSLVDEIDWFGKTVNLQMDRSDIQEAFNIWRSLLGNNLKEVADIALNQKTLLACNIFTASRSIFQLWTALMENAYAECSKHFSSKLSHFNKRWFGYLSERFTSIYLDVMTMTGKRAVFTPLMTIDGTRHPLK